MQVQKSKKKDIPIQVLVWLLPLLLYIVSSQFSTINTDGVRDYLAAFQIAYNHDIPSVGPQMAFTFHIGPWWFYLLSIPMLFTKSWAFQALFVSFLNSLKFYMAYKVGKKLVDKEFGIILVTCLMLGSFTLLQQWSFTHSNLVEVSILLVIYYSIHFNSKKITGYFLLGILTGLALHAHPTAGVVGYWVLLKILKSKNIFMNGTIYLIGIILVFSPILIHQFNSNYVDIKATSDYFSHYTGSYDYSTFFKMIYGVIFHAPYMLYKTLFPVVIAKLLLSVHTLFLLIVFIKASALLIKSKVNRNLIIKLFGFLVFTILFLFFIRNKTPWYMTYSMTLSFSLLLASLIHLIYSKYKLNFLPMAFYCIGLLIMLSTVVSISVKLNSSISLAEASMNNIRTLDTKLGNKRFEFPAYLSNEHGKTICKDLPVTLNGPYAALIYTHSGIEQLAECGKGGLYYGYSDAMKNLFAVPHFFKELISTKPINQIGNSYFYQPKSIHSENKLNQEKYLSDYDRSIKRIPNWKSVIKTAYMQKGKYLVITKQIGFLMETLIKQVVANDETLLPIASYDYSSLYYCQACDENKTEWEVIYAESVEAMTNIVSF